MTSCLSGRYGTFLIAQRHDSRTKWSLKVSDSKPAIYRDPFSRDNQPAPHRRHRNGSRAKLAKKFFEDTYAAWEEQGESALARAAFHDPMGFVSMVARLMPQKIEVSTPTDGMSDERLAELLEVAERMAALRAQGVATPLLAHELADENAVTLDQAEEGGGGPDRAHLLGGINTPSALRPPRADTPVAQHNRLDVPDSDPATPSSDIAETPSLLYPVGRACPETDAAVERRNRAKLHDDVDPASLF
jgi:hypothetical protein